MGGYSPHAHVQRVYGGQRQYRYWKCPVKRCGETAYSSAQPACPFHQGTLMKPKRGQS
jgi:hypothetical protein